MQWIKHTGFLREFKNDVLCYTRTRIIHCVCFSWKNLLCLPYLIRISNIITVCWWYRLLHSSFCSFLTQRAKLCTSAIFSLWHIQLCKSPVVTDSPCRSCLSLHLMFIVAVVTVLCESKQPVADTNCNSQEHSCCTSSPLCWEIGRLQQWHSLCVTI